MAGEERPQAEHAEESRRGRSSKFTAVHAVEMDGVRYEPGDEVSFRKELHESGQVQAMLDSGAVAEGDAKAALGAAEWARAEAANTPPSG
jgi:hypothetical protein